MQRALLPVALALTFAAMSHPARGGNRVYPQYELDTNVYLTVIPKPKRERYEYRFYRVTQPVLIVDDKAGDQRLLKPFQAFMKNDLGLTLAANPETIPPSCDLLVHLNIKGAASAPFAVPSHPHPDHREGYVLKVAANDGRVEAWVTGNSLKGAQHGLQSLRQLMMKRKDMVIVREAELVDWPDVPFRFVKRPFAYWLDQAVRYKMNGGTCPASGAGDSDLDKYRKGRGRWVADHESRLLNHLWMVNMGNLYRGSEEAIRRRVGFFECLYDMGATHLAIMNDDRLALADAEARRRFGGYYETQLHYLRRIDEALRKKGYRNRLAFMPNAYHGDHLNEHWVQIAKEKLPEGCALFLAGDHVPGIPVNVEHLATLRDQVAAQHLWYYTNWPQCSGPGYAENWGATRHHDFGRGDVIELVTVSTTTTPRVFPTSFITMADRLWNARDYDPDRALVRAVKEVVGPESYSAFYALFKYIESIAPYPMTSEFGPMYAAGTHDERAAIIEVRCAKFDRLAADCLKTPAAEEPRAKKLLEALVGQKERALKRLAREEKVEAEGKTPRELVCPLVAKGPTLDGLLEDGVWKKAAVATDFTDLRGGKAAPHQTTVRVLRTSDRLYFAVVCDEPHIDDPQFLDVGFEYPLAISEEPGASLWWAESIELFLDPGRDRRGVYQLMLNPWGLKQCLRFSSVHYGFYGKTDQRGDNWPVIGKANKLKDAWTLEFTIPLSAFGDGKAVGTWGFNVTRNRRITVGKGLKWSTWTPLGWGFQDARNFGKLVFKP